MWLWSKSVDTLSYTIRNGKSNLKSMTELNECPMISFLLSLQQCSKDFFINDRVTWKPVFVFAKPFHLFTILAGCDCREILNSLKTFSVSKGAFNENYVTDKVARPELWSHDTVIREKVNVKECLNYHPVSCRRKVMSSKLFMRKGSTCTGCRLVHST